MCPATKMALCKGAFAWLCLACAMFSVRATEYTILTNFKEAQRSDKGASGITTSYGIMGEERAVLDTWTMATVNHTYYDSMDELFRLNGENNAKFGEGKVFPAHGRLVHVTSAKDPNDHSACHPNLRASGGQRWEFYRYHNSRPNSMLTLALQVAHGALDRLD